MVDGAAESDGSGWAAARLSPCSAASRETLAIVVTAAAASSTDASISVSSVAIRVVVLAGTEVELNRNPVLKSGGKRGNQQHQ